MQEGRHEGQSVLRVASPGLTGVANGLIVREPLDRVVRASINSRLNVRRDALADAAQRCPCRSSPP